MAHSGARSSPETDRRKPVAPLASTATATEQPADDVAGRPLSVNAMSGCEDGADLIFINVRRKQPRMYARGFLPHTLHYSELTPRPNYCCEL